MYIHRYMYTYIYNLKKMDPAAYIIVKLFLK